MLVRLAITIEAAKACIWPRSDTNLGSTGGDEVSFDCWNANPDVKHFMAQHNMTATGLNNYYMSKLFAMIVGNASTVLRNNTIDDDEAQTGSNGPASFHWMPFPSMGKKDVMVWRPGAADHGVDLPMSLIFDVCVS